MRIEQRASGLYVKGPDILSLRITQALYDEIAARKYMDDLILADIRAVKTQINNSAIKIDVISHLTDMANPHQVRHEQTDPDAWIVGDNSARHKHISDQDGTLWTGHVNATGNVHNLTPQVLGAIANAGGIPSIQKGLESQRPDPDPARAGRLYLTEDTGKFCLDTGTNWEIVGGESTVGWESVVGKPDLVLNLGGIPSIQVGSLSGRPSPDPLKSGRWYVTTDTKSIFRDTGSNWDQIGGQDTMSWEDITDTPDIAEMDPSDFVLNEGVPAMLSGTENNRPTPDPSQAGRLYVCTDTGRIFQDTGTTWAQKGGQDTLSWVNITNKPYLFTKFKVGTSEITPDGETDTLTFEAGQNISLTPNVTSDILKIEVTGIPASLESLMKIIKAEDMTGGSLTSDAAAAFAKSRTRTQPSSGVTEAVVAQYVLDNALIYGAYSANVRIRSNSYGLSTTNLIKIVLQKSTNGSTYTDVSSSILTGADFGDALFHVFPVIFEHSSRYIRIQVLLLAVADIHVAVDNVIITPAQGALFV
jgi:hypothetical protein